MPRPKGRVLIISPFNYPVSLALIPTIGALAAGNQVVLKPSERTPTVSACLKKRLSEKLPQSSLRVEEGGAETVQRLLQENFDHFFFTGSEKVGRIVYQAAAKQISTINLELGGKCPTLVWEPKDLELALKKIVWAKFYNSGQTCVAPDYLVYPKNMHDSIVSGLKAEIKKQFGDQPCCSKHFRGK